MTELPRYSTRQIVTDSAPWTDGPRKFARKFADNHAWIKASDHDAYVADVSSRLQQLEEEKAALVTEQRILEMEKADAAASWDRIDALRNEAEEEVDSLRAALAETRAALQQLTDAFERRLHEFEVTPDVLNNAKELLARVDIPADSLSVVPQPRVGDTSTDR